MKMMLMKWLFLLLTISAIEGSLKLWKPAGSLLEQRATKKILDTCYEDNDFKDLIFIIGDFNEVLNDASVIRMKNSLNVDEDYESRQFSSIGVTKVLIIEDSPEKLHSDLISFKKTRWWNHMLPFLIIGKNDEKCENFKEMLNITWEMDIINSIYICSKSEITTLYTLNPITNYAPDPWNSMEDLNDLNIYHQILNSHISCDNLNYDKTKILNGYELKFLMDLYKTDWIRDDTIEAYSVLPYFRLFHTVMKQLNASFFYKILLFITTDDSQYIEESNAQRLPMQLKLMESFKIPLLFRIEGTYRQVVLVKFNERTVLYKIGHLWSIQVLCGAAVSLIILFLILVMKNGGITSAMLDLIRFLTYLSIQTDMRSNSFRIYFTTMLIFIVISNGVFQGKIAAFLTTLDKVPPIKTMEELWDSGYHFYMVHSWSMDLLPWTDSKKHSRVTIIDDDACIDYVLNGTLNACIVPSSLYEKKYLLKPLDCIRPPSHINQPNNWKSRHNWPLYERFNYMLMRVIECGIYAKWQDEELYIMKDKLKADDHELALAEIVPPFQTIELVKLDFAFKLLAIGLSFATSVLIIELRMR